MNEKSFTETFVSKSYTLGLCSLYDCFFTFLFSGFESRYGSIKKQAQANSKDLRYHFDQLCKFQAKCNKLRSWCNETEIKCSTPLHLDCATSILRNQFDEYQVNFDLNFSFDSQFKVKSGQVRLRTATGNI